MKGRGNTRGGRFSPSRWLTAVLTAVPAVLLVLVASAFGLLDWFPWRPALGGMAVFAVFLLAAPLAVGLWLVSKRAFGLLDGGRLLFSEMARSWLLASFRPLIAVMVLFLVFDAGHVAGAVSKLSGCEPYLVLTLAAFGVWLGVCLAVWWWRFGDGYESAEELAERLCMSHKSDA